ncbi:MAG TPA: acyl carrier protein [Rhodospirillales bacterium]|nr:acyl carrier protein [Rhodospirillales bacterium]
MLDKYNPEGRPVSAETDLGADLAIDSVAAMDLIMEIEDHFEIDIPINLVTDLRTVGDLVELVRQQLEGRSD